MSQVFIARYTINSTAFILLLFSGLKILPNSSIKTTNSFYHKDMAVLLPSCIQKFQMINDICFSSPQNAVVIQASAQHQNSVNVLS